MGKRQEYYDLLRHIDPDGDFDGLIPAENKFFDGHIHSVLELSTGRVHLSQGETTNEQGFVVAIYFNGRHEELKPGEYEIVEVLQWNEETDELKVVPYTEESQ